VQLKDAVKKLTLHKFGRDPIACMSVFLAFSCYHIMVLASDLATVSAATSKQLVSVTDQVLVLTP